MFTSHDKKTIIEAINIYEAEKEDEFCQGGGLTQEWKKGEGLYFKALHHKIEELSAIN